MLKATIHSINISCVYHMILQTYILYNLRTLNVWSSEFAYIFYWLILIIILLKAI